MYHYINFFDFERNQCENLFHFENYLFYLDEELNYFFVLLLDLYHLYWMILSIWIFHLIYLISAVGFSVNCFLATFNLFPIYSLDGTKVLKWNVGIWIAAIAIAGIMMFVSIAIGAENAVQLIMGV